MKNNSSKNNRNNAVKSLGLSRRETEVLNYVAEGRTNHEVSSILGISERTVEKHLEKVYTKLGVETRTAAAAIIYNLRDGKNHGYVPDNRNAGPSRDA